MAAITAEDIEDIRDWVGVEPADSVIEAAWARAGEHSDRTALVILRRRRADLIATPGKFSVEGDYSQDTTANLDRLDRQIARLERLVPGETDESTGGYSTVFLTRDGAGR